MTLGKAAIVPGEELLQLSVYSLRTKCGLLLDLSGTSFTLKYVHLIFLENAMDVHG